MKQKKESLTQENVVSGLIIKKFTDKPVDQAGDYEPEGGNFQSKLPVENDPYEKEYNIHTV
jgi:hypothetical protein